MATSYPTGLDSLTNPTAGDSMQSLSHAGQHANANDAIEAIQAVLGLSPQGGSASVGARCAALESGKASLSGSVSFGGTVGGTGLSGSLLSSASPVMNGAASAGTAVVPSRQDHVHPSDTSRAALSGATFTGNVSLGATGIDYGNAALQKVKLGGTVIKRAQVGSSYNGLEIKDGNDATNVDIRLDGSSTWKGPLTIDMAAPAIALGASGPKILVGTGSPEGAVTAPVGSRWTDTAATTGAVEWIKATGTGSTGWRVSYGDTGRRTGFSLQSGFVVASSVNYLSRSAGIVQYQAILQKSAGNYVANDIPVIIPDGFRPASAFYQYAAGLNNGTQVNISIPTNGEVTIAGNASAAYLYLNLTFRTEQPWPSTLPGTAA